MKGVIITYKEYYLKQHPESASIIDRIIINKCPAEYIDCQCHVANKIKCLLYQDNKTDIKELREACWNQKMEENIKEEKEKKNMTYKELWIKLHPGEDFIHANEETGHCPDHFNYEKTTLYCPKDGNGEASCHVCWDREVPEETIEKFLGKKTIKTPKFKVGDRVKVVNPVSGCTGAKHKIGIVTNEKARNGLDGSTPFPTIHIKLEKSGSTWCVNEDGCVLVTKGSANTASQTKKSPKFNIGDKVRVIHPEDGCVGCGGEIGIVTTEEAGNGLFGNEPYPTINIKIQDINSVCYNQIWCVNEDGCELINEIPALEKTTDDFPHFDDWTGKIIKLKSGKVYLVVSFDVAYYRNNALISPNGDIKISIGNLLPETIDGDKIVEIYKFAPLRTTLAANLTDLGTSELLWKAKEKKKMSYEDIVAALGYEFELV